MFDDEDERTLVEQARAGDRLQLTLLLAEVRPHLLARVAGRIPPALQGIIEPDDVVQEALVVAMASLRQFRWRGAGSFYRWVATIAVRKLREWARAHRAMRRGGGRPVLGGATPSRSYLQLLDGLTGSRSTPSRSLARLEAAAALHAAVSELPEDQRRAVELVYFEGQPLLAVAAALGRSEPAVQQLCHRARLGLRERLGDAARFLSGVGPASEK